jgi:hypothetical protein
MPVAGTRRMSDLMQAGSLHQKREFLPKYDTLRHISAISMICTILVRIPDCLIGELVLLV